MTQWIEELLAALDRGYGSAPRIMVLATVDRSGGPHARCVVCRKIDEEGRIYLGADARTQKNANLRGNPKTELVVWLPSIEIQFRITGEAAIVSYPADEPLRKEIWRSMSHEARSTLFWPTPGIAAATDDAFAQAVSAEVPPPQTFEVVIITPKQVDRLSLDSHPHRRKVWRADAQWAGVDVNP